MRGVRTWVLLFFYLPRLRAILRSLSVPLYLLILISYLYLYLSSYTLSFLLPNNLFFQFFFFYGVIFGQLLGCLEFVNFFRELYFLSQGVSSGKR